jgi:RNA polymerase-associated protein
MKLFLLYRCPFAHRATFVLREKGLSFEPVFFEQRKRPPELEAVGPYAKSPTLIDGDTRVWDSQIVIEYLEDRYPEPNLMPSEAAQRAEIRMLAARAERELGSKLGTIVVERLYKPQADEAKIVEARREFIEALEAWDRRLEGRTFLVGDALSLADVTLYTIFPAMLGQAGVDVPEHRKHLRAWRDRMAARPSSPLLEPRS